MGQVFVSYSRRDLDIVNRLVEVMERAGLNIWIDREAIKAGKLWRTQIVQAIDTCDAFVLMLSSSAAASDNVRKEIDLAQDSGRNIFILNLDQVKIPRDMRYQLVGLQFIDLIALGFDPAIDQLIETIKAELKSTMVPADPLEPEAPLQPAEPARSVEPMGPPVRQAELVIQGVDAAAFGPEMQAQLLDFISQLVKTPPSQLHIANVTAGSVHLFVDMPAQAAFELKALALNRDQRFRQFGIKALRLIGDRKYINIALGVLTATATIGLLQYLWLSIPSLFPSIFGVAAGKVILIASAVALAAAAGAAITPEPSISNVTLITVPFEEIGAGPHYTITAEIPQLTGSDDPRVQAFNQTLNDLVKAVVDSYRNQFLPGNDPDAFAGALEVKYDLVSRIDDVWSLKLNIDGYLGESKGLSGLESISVNYDLGQGRQLALADLFLPGSNYLEVIASYCIADLHKQIGEFSSAKHARGAEPTPGNYRNWNITPEGLLITFDPDQVDDYESGPRTVIVPYSELQAIIDPEGPLGRILQ